jgi:hypothetical protein
MIFARLPLSEYVPDVCDVCGSMYAAAAQPKVRGYTCHRCDKRFPTGEKLIGHSLLHTHLSPFWCQFCNREYTRRVTLMNHIAQQHQASAVDLSSYQRVDLLELLDTIALEDMPLPQEPQGNE